MSRGRDEEIGTPAPSAKGAGSKRRLARAMSRVHRACITLAPRLFAGEFLVVARNRPTTARVLAATRASAYVEAA
jgi:hypothetical protein